MTEGKGEGGSRARAQRWNGTRTEREGERTSVSLLPELVLMGLGHT